MLLPHPSQEAVTGVKGEMAADTLEHVVLGLRTLLTKACGPSDLRVYPFMQEAGQAIPTGQTPGFALLALVSHENYVLLLRSSVNCYVCFLLTHPNSEICLFILVTKLISIH